MRMSGIFVLLFFFRATAQLFVSITTTMVVSSFHFYYYINIRCQLGKGNVSVKKNHLIKSSSIQAISIDDNVLNRYYQSQTVVSLN